MIENGIAGLRRKDSRTKRTIRRKFNSILEPFQVARIDVGARSFVSSQIASPQEIRSGRDDQILVVRIKYIG